MKTALVVGLLMGGMAAGMLLAAGPAAQVSAQPTNPYQAGASGELIALATPASENRQQITVIDPRTRVMSVYHIDQNSGVINLKSVRNITWDLQTLQFNTNTPLPSELRSSVDQK